MGNGFPEIGPVPEEPEAPRDKGKKRFLNFSFGEINWLNVGKGIAIVLLAIGGSIGGDHWLGNKEYVDNPALAAEIETVKGDVKEWKAVTTIVQQQVNGIASKTDATQKDVGELKTATKVLETKMDNLKEKADELDKNQEKLQDGINKILQKLK